MTHSFLNIVFDPRTCFLLNTYLFPTELKCCPAHIGKCYAKPWEDNTDLERGMGHDVLEEFDSGI